MNTCETCKHFIHYLNKPFAQFLFTVDENVGQCGFNPPQIIVFKDYMVSVVQPMVYKNLPGCSKHEDYIEKALQLIPDSTMIEDMGLTIRTRNALIQNNVFTLYDLKHTSVNRCLSFPGIGRGAIHEITSILKSKNIHWQ